MERLKVGVLGATGMVGQNYLRLLHDHPWFEVSYVGASPRSAGKRYTEAVQGRWHMNAPIPVDIQDLVVGDANSVQAAQKKCDMVFSAIEAAKDQVRSLEEAYAAEELTPEEFETEARQAFATHLPTESWQVVLEFLVQEGGFTELRVSGADWDRDARSGEIQGRFGHQTGMSYAGPEHLDRYASDQGDAELTHDLTEQTFSGDFTTTVADYVTGQTYGEVTILFEVDPCEGLGFEDAAIWW